MPFSRPEDNPARWLLQVRKLAAEFDAVLVDFQAMFDEACKVQSAEYWGPDGVHPSHAGHMLMAKTWLEAVTGA